MKSKGNTISIGLMICSIFLLVILQFLWIRNSYERAFMDFHDDTNLLFRSTVITLRNAEWLKSMVEIKDDSQAGIHRILLNDSTRMNELQMFTRRNIGKVHKTDTIIADRKLGIQKIMLRSRRTGWPVDSVLSEGKSFIIRIENDTLNADSLRFHFKKALENKSIKNPFTTRLVNENPSHNNTIPPVVEMFSGRTDNLPGEVRPDPKMLRVFSDTVKTDLIRISPNHFYEATFYNVRNRLLIQILPQIIFSIVLTVLVIVAFYMMQKNMQAQVRLMEAKNDFINNVTHELKTPVATVSVALEAFRNFDAMRNPSLTKEYLDIAQRELARLVSITDKILRTSVIEEQSIVVFHQPVDLHAIANEVVSSMKLIADSTNSILALETFGNDFTLNGSPDYLQGMLSNLIDNALKYRAPGRTTEIRVTLERLESNIRVSVIDNGIGIHKSYHSRIFDKFFRVPLGDIHPIKGYGLGLNFVYTVVKNHRGQIDVKSTPGEGSEFIILLPAIKNN